jgi:hypothetical protein
MPDAVSFAKQTLVSAAEEFINSEPEGPIAAKFHRAGWAHAAAVEDATVAFDDEVVESPGRIFRFGDYPAKDWSITRDEFIAANGEAGEIPVGFDPIGLKNYEGKTSALDGITGDASFAVGDDDVRAVVKLPKWLDDVRKELGLKISAVFDRASKVIRKIDLVDSPQVKDAVFFTDDNISLLEDDQSVAFADRSTSTQNRSSDMSTTTESAAREARRAETAKWVKERQAEPRQPAAPKVDSPSIGAANGHAPEPPFLLHLDQGSLIAKARSVLGSEFDEMLIANRDSYQPGPGFNGKFDADRLRARAILDRLSRGIALDQAEVEQEVADELLKHWFDVGKGKLNDLTSTLANYAVYAKTQARNLVEEMEYHKGQLRNYKNLIPYVLAIEPLESQSKALFEKSELATKAVEALPIAVGRLASEAIEAAGGTSELVGRLKESLMSRGEWPGKDYELNQLEVKLNEASRKMDGFRDLDPDTNEGPLAAAARAEVARLVPMVENRKVEAYRLATNRLHKLVSDATGGSYDAVAEIGRMVELAPSGFPTRFAATLAAIPLAAAIEAGSLAYMAVLS